MAESEALAQLPSAFLCAGLADYVVAYLGLRCPLEPSDKLGSALHALAGESGAANLEICGLGLLGRAPTKREIEILATQLTNGETYFMREPESFRALQQHVLPDLIRQKRKDGAGTPTLRIWSAGCATGEEAYSLAILLELALPDLAEWDIRIVATDINPGAIETAKRGLYRDWSLRGVPTALIERFFQHHPDGRFEPLPRLRDRIDFGWFNLADEAVLPPGHDGAAFDLILCRNVLVYFDPDAAKRLVQRLAAACGTDGWLLVAAVESTMPLFDAFTPVVGSAGSTVFRKRPAPGPDVVTAQRAGPRRQPAARPVIASAQHRMRDKGSPSERARMSADRGALADAEYWSEQAIAIDRTDPALHYLHATILLEKGRRPEGEAALRRAIFLAPNLVLAHCQLGALAIGDGRHPLARRHLDNALAILACRDPEEPLDDTAGLGLGASMAGLTTAALAGMIGALRQRAESGAE